MIAVQTLPAERRLPRPRPEHVLALVDDLKAARLLVEDGTELERSAGLATIALVERLLTNLAAALGGPR